MIRDERIKIYEKKKMKEKEVKIRKDIMMNIDDNSSESGSEEGRKEEMKK